MKKIKINGTEFSLEKQNYTFLDNYIKRLKSYIKEHNVDQDLYDDILIRLEEKLSQVKENNKKKTITQKDCVAIINELGEPEDIFDIEEDSISRHANRSKNKDIYNESGTFFQKVYGDIVLFWGIFLFFAIATGLNIFILLFMIGVIMFIIYLFREKKRKSIRHFFGFLQLAIKRAWRNILTIARILFFCIGGIILFGFAIAVIIGIGAYFSNFSVGNIEVFGLVPTTLPIGGIFGIIALILFGIFFISYGIRKKGIGNTPIIIATISLFTGLFFGTMSGFSLFSKYFGQPEKNFEDTQILKLSDKTATHTSEKEKIYYIEMLYPNIPSEIFGAFNPRGAEIKASDDNTIKIVSEITWFGPEKIEKKIKENLIKPTITQDHEIIRIGYNTDKLFKEKTPLIYLKIHIKEIYIPKNIKFNTSFTTTQLSLPTNLKKYEPYITINDCQENYYDEKRQVFTCNISKETVARRQLQNIIYPLAWKTISDLSPIKHQEENKKRYYGDRSRSYSDWNIKNIDREGDKITIIYADQSISITASAKIKEKDQIIDEGGKIFPFVIQNFKIQKIIKNPTIYKDTYYQNPEKINKCENGC